MVEDKWLLLFGVPAIVFLIISIRRRIISINSRLQEIEREQQAKPYNPYEEFAAAWQPTKTKRDAKAKRRSGGGDIGNQDNG